MANPDSVKTHKEDANMAMTDMTESSVGFRNDQDYPSDAEGISAEERAQLAAKNSKKKSCFQITSVKETPQNDDNDSIDDMDESRAEDFSSSELLDVSKSSTLTDIERHDIGENSHSTPKKVTTNNVPTNSSIVNVNVNQAIPSNGKLEKRTGSEPPHELLHQVSDPGKASDPGKTTNGNQQGNGNPASRFKVVKVPRIQPFTRGRWTCRDYETQQSSQTSVDVVNRTEQQQNKDLKSGDSSAASSLHGENTNFDNTLGGENTTTGTSEQSGNKNSKSKTGLGFKSHLSDSSIAPHLDQHGSLEDTIKETFDVDPSAPSEDTNLSEDGDGTSAGGAIDNKIEQAMDLVKSHLLYAVREEVEVLKVQIKDLADKNEQLQRENAMLRQAAPEWPASAPQGASMAMPQQTLPQQQQPTALPQGVPQQTQYSAAGAPQGQSLPPPPAQQTLPPPQQGQLQGPPMGMQTLPPQQTAPNPQAVPQQQAAVLQLSQTAPQQNPEQYTHLQQQQSIPMQPSQQQQQHHSIPVNQQAGAPQQQGQQPLTALPNQAVQLSQVQQPSQPPKT